jgi:hypothetical protein
MKYEKAIAYFEVLYLHFLEELKKTTKNFSLYSLPAILVSNRESPEHESGVVTTLLWYSERHWISADLLAILTSTSRVTSAFEDESRRREVKYWTPAAKTEGQEIFHGFRS